MTSLFKKKQPKHVGAAFCAVSEVEQHLAESEFNIGKIQEIQNKFAGGEVLQVPGRVFVREGALVKVCRKGPKKRQFFLFNDVLVYGCILPKNRYGNQHIMPLSQMSVNDTCHFLPAIDDGQEQASDLELEEKLAFQLNHTDKSFHLYASSVSDKNNWIANLRKNIAKVSVDKDTDDPLVVRPVWVPDAMAITCMHCQQKFSTFVRKHHCRQCGKVVCSACSQNKLELRQKAHVTDPAQKPERVCDGCYDNFIQRNPQQPPSATEAASVVSKVIMKSMKGPAHKEDSEESEDSDDSAATLSAYTVSTEPTPPPRRKKDQRKTVNAKPEAVPRKKRSTDFSQLHQEFAPSSVLEQQKANLIDLDAEPTDQSLESGQVERPRRKKKHFKPADQQNVDHVTQEGDYVTQLDHVTQPEDNVTPAEDNVVQPEDHVTQTEEGVAHTPDQAVASDINTKEDHVTSKEDHVTSKEDHVSSKEDHVGSKEDPTSSKDDHVTSSGDHMTHSDNLQASDPVNELPKDTADQGSPQEDHSRRKKRNKFKSQKQ